MEIKFNNGSSIKGMPSKETIRGKGFYFIPPDEDNPNLFKMEYQSLWVKDEEYEKAELLWLWHDYKTEIFDRKLPGALPSPSDETSVVFMDYDTQCKSRKYAKVMYKKVEYIAKHYKISDEILTQSFLRYGRSHQSAQERIDLYLKLKELGKFDFMRM